MRMKLNAVLEVANIIYAPNREIILSILGRYLTYEDINVAKLFVEHLELRGL